MIHFIFFMTALRQNRESLSGWLWVKSSTVKLPREMTDFEFVFGSQARMWRILEQILLFCWEKFVYREKLFNSKKLELYTFLLELKNVLTVKRLACMI